MKTSEFLKGMMTKRNAELDELKARVEALEKINNDDNSTEEELKAAGEELDALNTKKAELEKELEEINAQIAALEAPAKEEEQPERKSFIKFEKRGNENMNLEERAATFVKTGRMTIEATEARATLVSSGTIATPTNVNGINELDNQVSSIVDLVNIENCEGYGSNKVAYEFTAPKGGVTVEGETYSEGETVFAFKTIAPETITTIAYISKQATKQSPLQYQAKIEKNAKAALRKAVSEYIVGKLAASDLCVKKDIDAIDAKTLRTVALNYGGDETVSGNAVLFLNKATLVKLGDVRGQNEKKAVYEITPDASNPNIGTIKDGGLSVTYCLNNHVAADTLIYGQAAKFELDLFSNYEVKVSEDFKFDKGLLTIRGDVEIGGDVVFKDGFIIATVKA